MRLALYEMFFCRDIPVAVSINEAIEIAKNFGSDESSKFINGVLDNVHTKYSSELARLRANSE